MTFRYSRAGTKLKKQDTRRDIEPALCDLEDQLAGSAGVTLSTVASFPAAATLRAGALVYHSVQKTYYQSDGVSAYKRLPIYHPDWTLVTSWYVNEATGSDENDGTIGGPLQSLDEIDRRIGNQEMPSGAQIQIYLMTAGSYGTFKWRGYNNTNLASPSVILNGTETKVSGGTITAVTAFDRTTGQYQQIEVSALSSSWTSLGYVNKFVVINSGPRAGAFALIAKDLGGGTHVARVTPFLIANTKGVITSTVVPQIGDTFDVITAQSTVAGIRTTFDVAGTTLGFIGLKFAITSYMYVCGFTQYSRCILNDSFFCSGANANNVAGCYLTTTYVSSSETGGYYSFVSCVISGVIQKPLGGVPGFGGMPSLRFSNDTIFQGGSIQVGDSQILFGNVGVYDVTGDFITIDRGRVDATQLTAVVLYGSGVSGIGVNITGDGSFRYATLPQFTTTGVNVSVKGTTKTWAQLPFRDLAANTSTGVITGSGAYAGPA